MKNINNTEISTNKMKEKSIISFSWTPECSKSIQMCGKHVIGLLDYIAELDQSNINPDLKYELVENVVAELKTSCDAILKCLEYKLKGECKNV